MKKHTTHILAAALTAALLLPVTSAFAGQKAVAPAEPETDKWSFDASLNLFLAGMSGNVTARGIPTRVDSSFSDIMKHLEAGAAGRFTLGYERWLLSLEFSYIRLGAEPPASNIEMEQWLVEPTLGYSLNKYAQVFAGARYNNLSGEVSTIGPRGAFRNTTGTQGWWDPIIGAQLSFPLVGDKLSLDGRFDVGGFDAGSRLTWQAFPYLNWHISKRTSAQIGYRWLGTDYSTGSGFNRFRYDVIAQGLQVGLTLHF
jgi:hypothetical protein